MCVCHTNLTQIINDTPYQSPWQQNVANYSPMITWLMTLKKFSVLRGKANDAANEIFD